MERFIWKGRAFALKYEFGGGFLKKFCTKYIQCCEIPPLLAIGNVPTFY